MNNLQFLCLQLIAILFGTVCGESWELLNNVSVYEQYYGVLSVLGAEELLITSCKSFCKNDEQCDLFVYEQSCYFYRNAANLQNDDSKFNQAYVWQGTSEYSKDEKEESLWTVYDYSVLDSRYFSVFHGIGNDSIPVINSCKSVCQQSSDCVGFFWDDNRWDCFFYRESPQVGGDELSTNKYYQIQTPTTTITSSLAIPTSTPTTTSSVTSTFTSTTSTVQPTQTGGYQKIEWGLKIDAGFGKNYNSVHWGMGNSSEPIIEFCKNQCLAFVNCKEFVWDKKNWNCYFYSTDQVKGTGGNLGYDIYTWKVVDAVDDDDASELKNLLELVDKLPWYKTSRICGYSLYIYDSIEIVKYDLLRFKELKCNTIEIDSGLSEWQTDEMFNQQLLVLKDVSNFARSIDLNTMIYIPSLETNVANACSQGIPLSTSISARQPEWIQRSLGGDRNVFCGNLEVWVEKDMESAWFDPNNEEYKTFFFGRVKQLASITNLDGMWADVPIYSDTVTNFAPGDKNSQELFVAWSKAKSLNGGSGFYRFPTTQEIKLPIFSAYLAWRHETLSDFQDNIRLAGEAGKSSFITASEVYSLDYMDGYWVGLDGGYRKSNKQLRVWEVDSVSNTQAMKYASIQDFRNKISMNKYAVASDNGQASWIFAYGNEPSDANLVMASILAVGANPFECKTPQMTETVGDEFRKKWFEFIDEHESLIYYMNRIATVGVYYSSSTRDYLDGSKNGNCFYGMFQDTTAIPNDDADWWSNDSSGNTLLNCKHLSLYRGSMGILNRLHIPHTLVIDNALGMQNKNVLKNLKVVILPNVVSMSQKSYNEIKNFMLDGGILIIVGSQIPATLDEYGVAYEKSLFQIDNYLPESIGNSKKFVKVIGEGALIFRSDINSYNVQSNNIGIMDFFETTFRTHVQEKAIINIDESSNLQSKENIYVEYGERNEFGLETIYIVNLNGVQQPIISSVTSRINIDYKAPRGKRVEKIRVYSADEYGWTGQLGFKEFSTQSSSGYWIRLDSFIINQFCIVAISLIDEDKTSASSVSAYDFPSTEWESVMNNGIAFIKNKMRDERFGIYTNYKDIPQIDDIYAVGHHVTAEHMGLFLRSSVCLNDEQGFLEGYNFVKKYMRSRLKNVVNWAVDKNTGLPFLQSFTEGEFINANAPLDDLRVIRGLIEGYEKFQITGSMSLANQLLRGLYWNGVTNIKQVASYSIGNYGNVMGYAYDWNSATGEGVLGIEPIPIDYSYLFVINQAVAYNPRWLKVLTDSTQMMLDSEIDFSPGLFYNGIDVQGEYTGDFEYRDLLTSNRGKHLKTIQTLWIALHLAEVGTDSNSYISESLKERALQASKRALDRYKAFYLLNNRVPEYMTYFGEDVSISGPDGLSFDENLINGEARIYAQIARIALILDDRSFSIQVISEKIISDSQTDVTSPLFGNIGLSTSSSEDAEAFNVLESTLTICLASQK